VGALERLCERRGLKLTEHRRIVLEVLESATDHRIGLATVYRSLNSLAAAGVVVRQTFSDGKARYEGAAPAPHEHLIDVATGQVLEVTEPQVAHLLQAVARDLGYRLVDYRLQLFGERRPS
jgi:Fur family ferric uptake transcriptional regulator